MQKAEYGVEIQGHDNGLVIRVGCKSFVVAEKDIDAALVDVKSLLTGGYKELNRLREQYLPNESKPEFVPCGEPLNVGQDCAVGRG